MRIFLRGATLIDGTGAEPVPSSGVLVEEDRIVAVGRLSDFGEVEHAQVVDLTGRFLLPGFINVHEHLTMKRVVGGLADRMRAPVEVLAAEAVHAALVNLAEGITTIRDLSSRDGMCRGLQRSFREGSLVVPDTYVCPQGFTVTGGYAWYVGVPVDSPDEARKAVRRMVGEGCDWVKCFASIEWERAEGEPISAVNMEFELMREIFAVAHHHGKRCTAHAIHPDAIRFAVEAGADSIEHGIMLDPDTAELMARRGTFLVPTLSGYLEHCNPAWGRGDGVVRHGHLLQEYHPRAFRRALAAGVRMAYGSDTLGNLPDEIRLMRQYGCGAMECVEIATRRGAELLGIADQVGTVREGKRADLVVLGSDPLESWQAFGDVQLVMRAGHLIRPADLPIERRPLPRAAGA